MSNNAKCNGINENENDKYEDEDGGEGEDDSHKDKGVTNDNGDSKNIGNTIDYNGVMM